jgi:hypothetical protein
VYSLVWLPLIGPLAMFTGVQLTPVAMVALLWRLNSRRLQRA